MKDPKTSVALYSVSSDVDGAKMAKEIAGRNNKAIAAMLASARESLTKDPQLVASVLQGAMAGISRKLLESPSPEKQLDTMRKELTLMACAYLNSCSAHESKKV